MTTVNGKLVAQEQNQLDTIKRKTEELQGRYQHLELQVTALAKQNSTKHLEEMGIVKSYLQKLDKKLNTLEETISNQAKQLLFLKVCSALGLVGLCLWFGMNNQPQYHKTKSFKHAEYMEFIKQV
jgi:predicted nuclease with TOPRIM domain